MIRLLSILLLLAALSGFVPVSARVFHAGERERATIALTDGWEYAPDPQGTAPRDRWATQLPEGKPIKLPTRWDDDPLTRDCTGAVWYARTLSLPEKLEHAGALLVLESPVGLIDIYYDGVLRDHFLGNGLTHSLQLAGEPNSQHRLTLRVDRQGLPAALRRVGSCGLGGISLELLPAIRLRSVILTPSLTSQTMTVQCRISADMACKAELNLRIMPFNGRSAVEKTKKPIPLDLKAGSTTQSFTISIKSLKRWSPSTPQVYRLYADLVLPGKTHDSCEVLCGACSATFSPKCQLLLNHTRVTLRGLRLPGGVPPPSPVAVAQALAADLNTAKKGKYPIMLSEGVPLTGEVLSVANSLGLAEMLLVRRAGYNTLMADGASLSEDVLTLADLLGIMVIAEIPPALPPTSEKADAGLQCDLRTAIETLGHHPCIIAWCWTSLGTPATEVAALRELDPCHAALVRTPKGSFMFNQTATVGDKFTEFDPLDVADKDGWLSALQDAGAGRLPVLVSGTTLESLPDATLAGQQGEQHRLYALRQQIIETVLRARFPMGYFVRPAHGETYTGLALANGQLTQASFAAMSYNTPGIILLRVTQQENALLPDALLINSAGATSTYQLYRLVTFPNGLTEMQKPRQVKESLLSGDPAEDLSDTLPPIPVEASGEYCVQYVLSTAGKVFATSQPVRITAKLK